MKWTVPRVWEGGRCFLIGGGPSVLKQFNIPTEIVREVYAGSKAPSAYSPFLEPIHKEHIIAVNVAYRIGDWIDCMFFGDKDTYYENERLLPCFRGLKVSCAPGIENKPGIKWLRRDPRKKKGITTDPSQVCWNHNSGAAAMNLAVHMGVRQIILLGFDMKLDEKKNQHWHKFYAGKLTDVGNTMKTHLSYFPAIAEDLKKLGVEVLNANPDSNITEFRKVNIQDVL